MKCPECQAEIGEESHFCSKCGTRVSPEGAVPVSITKTLQTPSKGVRIGITIADRYRIVEELGRGGMGIVYKAEDIRLERQVAIKFLPPELAQDESAKERFVREARAAAAVVHPNICTIHEVDEFEGQTFIAMEFVEGLSLRDMTKKGSIPVKDTLELAIQVANGLEEAHKQGIIHRDIKSANIMVNKADRAKIMDFGLAKVSGSAMITREGVAVGTVAYMSPEQARGEKVDQRTDIWSLGIVLYEMLSGQLPFWGEKEASVLYSIEHREHKPVRAFNPSIPSELETIINRCLQKKPEARYKSAGEIVSELRRYQDSIRAEEAGFFNLRSISRRIRQPKVAVPALIALAALAFFTFKYFSRQAEIRWAKNELLPEVERLIEESRSFNLIDAYNKAVEAEQSLPQDPTLMEYLDQCSLKISFETSPPGADIYMKEYERPENEWTYVGISPLESIRVPFGYLRWKIEKDGFETVLAASHTREYDMDTQAFFPVNLKRALDPTGSVPPGMVRIPSLNDFNDYYVDRYEVTNRIYKEFVDSGGYQNKDYWQHPFVKDGKIISWEEAKKEFVDSTGRPGPSVWQGGSFPEGKENYPVMGVSWYEAAAYSEFSGKMLPTIDHWFYATGFGRSRFSTAGFPAVLLPLSKFGGKDASPVGSHAGISFYGAYDLAGNVREWCLNESYQGRCLLGAAWNDPGFMFRSTIAASAWDRSEQNGFRCAWYPDNYTIPDRALRVRKKPNLPDYRKMPSVSDEVFVSLKDRFSYDDFDLKSEVIHRDGNSEYWVKEKVSFTAAYGDERVEANIFLPKKVDPPYQTVMFFPGSGDWYLTTSDNLEETYQFKAMLEFIIKDGRAVVYPTYKGIFERGNPEVYAPLVMKFNSYEGAEYWIQIIKDFRRTLDYLETRSDIDMEKVAIQSYSWGFLVGTLLPAIEDRLAANVILLSGMHIIERDEVNPINYVRRVTIPTLLIVGEYDSNFDLELRGKPLFDLLGTPEDKKHLEICESDHFIQKNIVIGDVLGFLDKYFGSAKSLGQNE